MADDPCVTYMLDATAVHRILKKGNRVWSQQSATKR